MMLGHIVTRLLSLSSLRILVSNKPISRKGLTTTNSQLFVSSTPINNEQTINNPLGLLHDNHSKVMGHANDNGPKEHEQEQKIKNWLIVGDGDLSYSATIAADVEESSGARIIASVLEEESEHETVYANSKQNSALIQSSNPINSVRFGIDATQLENHFPNETFDIIEFNFPHWRGKTNNRYNRQLLNDFLASAKNVLSTKGEIRITLCDGQGGSTATTLDSWRQSWMCAMYASNHGLLLQKLEPYYEPRYQLSSHRGVDRPFFIGECPEKYYFTFPNNNDNNNDRQCIDKELQISCRNELRIMLHDDKLQSSCPKSKDDIVSGDAVLELVQPLIPKGIRFEIPARVLLTPYILDGDHVPLAVFLLVYSGESVPLNREMADSIRANIEATITKQWGLTIAKGGRLVSRPFPYPLLGKLIKEYNEG